jgi:hypothetical protein
MERIIVGGSNGVACDDRAIRRILTWWSIVVPYFINILKSLAEKYGTAYFGPPAFRVIVRAIANSNNWVFANSICTRSVVLSG